MTKAFLVHPGDSCAILTEAAAAGDRVAYLRDGTALTLTALDPVPQYHKIAVRDLPAGSPVIKYGEVIGTATRDIPAGSHIHTHNLSDETGGSAL